MKKIVTMVVLAALSVGFIAAESLDKAWIIKENTGSPATMKRLERPDLSPGQTIDVYIEQAGLAVKWGEGYVTYTYAYFSESGTEIWRSEVFTHKQKVNGNSWTFGNVQRITIPGNIPRGAYRIGISLVDYHTNKTYVGNVSFTVGQGSSSAPQAGPAQQPPGGKTAAAPAYTVRIGTVELSLVSVTKDSNRLTLVFSGVNRGDTDQELRLYVYKTKIVSGGGETFLYSDHGAANTSFVSGVVFPPGVPVRGEIYFKPPVTKIDFIALFEMVFYYTEDKVSFRDIPVPWNAAR